MPGPGSSIGASILGSALYRAYMTPSTPQHLRTRLTTAAFELFRANGYEATTVDDIATAAGVSRRTFFRHYRSKDDVIFPDHDRLLDIVQKRLDALPDEHGVDAVCEALRLILAHYVEERAVSLCRYELVGEVPALREREMVSVARYQRVFRDRIAKSLGDSDDAQLEADIMAAGLAAAHNHVLRRWLRSRGVADPQTQLNRAVRRATDAFSSAGWLGRDRRKSAESRDVTVLVFHGPVSAHELAGEIERARNVGPSAMKRTRVRTRAAATRR